MKQIPLHTEKQPIDQYLEELLDYCIYFHQELKGFWFQDSEKIKGDYMQMLMERSNESQYVLIRNIYQYRKAVKEGIPNEVEILGDVFAGVESLKLYRKKVMAQSSKDHEVRMLAEVYCMAGYSAIKIVDKLIELKVLQQYDDNKDDLYANHVRRIHRYMAGFEGFKALNKESLK